jgi:hypothetical protein
MGMRTTAALVGFRAPPHHWPWPAGAGIHGRRVSVGSDPARVAVLGGGSHYTHVTVADGRWRGGALFSGTAPDVDGEDVAPVDAAAAGVLVAPVAGMTPPSPGTAGCPQPPPAGVAIRRHHHEGSGPWTT